MAGYHFIKIQTLENCEIKLSMWRYLLRSVVRGLLLIIWLFRLLVRTAVSQIAKGRGRTSKGHHYIKIKKIFDF